MRILKITELIVDYNLYPRTQIDGNHVRYMFDAYKTKTKFPPIIIDKQSKRIIDGVHRYTMYKRVDENMEVEVIEKQYKDEAEMFFHAMKLNANHGKTLSPFDRSHCVLKADELGVSLNETATALSMTVDEIGKLRSERTGKLKISGKLESIPIKRTIEHMAGKTLTERQWQANDRLGGMNQLFYVNQIVELIEAKLIDAENDVLIKKLKYLGKLINEI